MNIDFFKIILAVTALMFGGFSFKVSNPFSTFFFAFLGAILIFYIAHRDVEIHKRSHISEKIKNGEDI